MKIVSSAVPAIRLASMAAALAASLAASLAAVAPAAADAAAGATIATRWCANCHVVAADQQAGVEGVASFASIAGRLDDAAIRAVLFRPHPPMPEFSLTDRQVSDLVAYIRSQTP